MNPFEAFPISLSLRGKGGFAMSLESEAVGPWAWPCLCRQHIETSLSPHRDGADGG